MNNVTKALQVMSSEIKSMIQSYFESMSPDFVVGKVVTALGDSKYSVRVKGTVYTVPSCTSDTYSADQNVLILVQKSPNRKYIIGKAVS